MPLSVGDKLGPYEILTRLGAGGMGEVKACDKRLDRIVAVKISQGNFDERFEREGRAIASLNHPNIAAIYGLEETATKARAIVMEMVEGPTLADRIQAALELKTALEIAPPIIGALEAAHDKGIVHRDLKPANILTTESGVKLLDVWSIEGHTIAAMSAGPGPANARLTMGLTESSSSGRLLTLLLNQMGRRRSP